MAHISSRRSHRPLSIRSLQLRCHPFRSPAPFRGDGDKDGRDGYNSIVWTSKQELVSARPYRSQLCWRVHSAFRLPSDYWI